MTTPPFWAEHAELAGHYTDRGEWLELRRTGIGSSDCSAVLGMGKYGSPFSVWAEKTGKSRPADETEAMMWGTLLEPVIRAELARRLDVDIVECPTLRSLARPWQLYNPDGLILAQNALVEIKNASAWRARDWEDGEVPDHAELQIQHGCAVTGADGAYVAGLIGGNRLRWEYVPRDDELIATINAAEQHLWDTYIVPDVAPPIDGSDATAEAIAARWPQRPWPAEIFAEDPFEVEAAIVAYRSAVDAEKAAKVAKATAVNQLADMLQGNDALLDNTGRKLVAVKRGQFRERAFREEQDDAEWLHKVEIVDRDRLKAEDPELYRAYQSTSIYIPKGK